MNRLLAIAFALLLGACATQTPYQPEQKGRGYSDQRLESNRYKITFAGNSDTPKKTVENYLLYRAAEVTLLNGYDYFVMSQQNTDSQTRYNQSFSGGFGGYGWYPRSSLGLGVSTAVPSTEYQGEIVVVMFKGQKPDSEIRAFNARDLKANLESSVVRPGA